MVGPQDVADKSPIYPMLAQIPAEVSETFLTDHIMPRELVLRVRDMFEETVVWSIDRSYEIINGKDSEATDGVTVVTEVDNPVEGTVVRSNETDHSPSLPQLPAASEDRIVNPNELNWIVQAYCMNNNALVTQVCQRFGVSEAAQLRKVHFDTLQSESAQYTQQ
jgi:hypothetical protein